MTVSSTATIGPDRQPAVELNVGVDAERRTTRGDYGHLVRREPVATQSEVIRAILL